MARTLSRLIWISALNVSGLVPHGRKKLRRFLPPAVMAIEGRLFELHPAENYTDYRMFVDRKFAESQSISRLR
ncbi:hypothetical protein, partial [Rhodovulum sp.]|uniref:hypothetical protein n=1 Tax=Rhodovulum sp. TaxID=34009 RepID=UPI00257C8BC3